MIHLETMTSRSGAIIQSGVRFITFGVPFYLISVKNQELSCN